MVVPVAESNATAALVSASSAASATASASAPASVRAGSAPLYATASSEGSAALALLLARAVASRASDVHLLDACTPVFRIDGSLRPVDDAPPVHLDSLLAPWLDVHARERLASGRSADVGFELEAVGRIRMNVYRASNGLAAALRLLPRTPPPLSSLHMPAPLDDLAQLPHGLVIVCGPTGSGKSTTLAAIAQEALRRRSVFLLTLEDPIEYELAAGSNALVRQRQIGRDVCDFATGLRDGLREDPDILLLGEMRDPETISLALTAAETGHLVLATLHSRSTASAVERIVDVYPAERQNQIRVQLADALRVVVAQRLLPRNRGGRIPALEILRVTHNVASVIREGKTAQIPSAIQSGRKDGMLALERCLADLVNVGHITLEDARAVANEPASLASYLGAR
jgi:twitching motility protein PilT